PRGMRHDPHRLPRGLRPRPPDARREPGDLRLRRRRPVRGLPAVPGVPARGLSARAAPLWSAGIVRDDPAVSAAVVRAGRGRVVMERHGFGRGEYKYFGYPLPTLVDALRRALYPRLVPVANHWRRSLGQRGRLPERLDDFLSRCHAAGQRRPTPLVLRYGAGD